ncbi:MAG: HD domain-containing protein [Gammaproteobacteria bacterium]|nr:HD domain-containing protein [Gammaproteobacteria bacterium]
MSYETQELFVPVHGFVSLTTREMEVINHPALQRLRRTRQLGFAHLVFPGAVHTRFEHSIGAVHVAERIVTHVNENHGRNGVDHPTWLLGEVLDAERDVIRLATLLHDIGHIPFGHTLEDELRHLPPHDGHRRLTAVSTRIYDGYRPGESATSLVTDPDSVGWSLETLVDTLYGQTVHEGLGIASTVSAFSVVLAIISKEPSEPEADADDGRKAELVRIRSDWQAEQDALGASFNLSLCRDVVGNTICADFLDYLYRDWHHLGKPLYVETRIYQYMEARMRNEGPDASDHDRPKSTGLDFLINIGSGEKIRHDALTSILQLLEARYELAETVLFHRAKLAITALLDRCLLEIEKFYGLAGIPRADLHDALEHLLLDSSDDGLPDVLWALTEGTAHQGIGARLEEAIDKAKSAASAETGPDLLTSGPTPVVPLEQTRGLIEGLIQRLRHRSVYKVLYKLRFSDVLPPYGVDESGASRVVRMYADVDRRRAFLHGVETLCALPPGSLAMYCPPTKMNAKVADVKLLIEDDVVTFAEYDQRRSQSNLSRGALSSRTQRFAELWSTQVFLDRRVWTTLASQSARGGSGSLAHLRHVVRTSLYQPEGSTDLDVARIGIQPSIDAVKTARFLQAARSGTPEVDVAAFPDGFFPSGLPYRNPADR